MPIFEYECLSCGAAFEKLLWRTEAVPAIACPMCGGTRIEEKISTFASMAKASSAGSCAPSG